MSLTVTGSNSLPSGFRSNYASSQGFRCLAQRSLVSRPPNRSFFSKLFDAIVPIFRINFILVKITGIREVISGQHSTDREKTQAQGNSNHWQRHSAEWNYKNRLATMRAKVMLAIKNPKLFARKFVNKYERGSVERMKMTGMLKRFNKKYYEDHVEELGEALEWPEDEDIIRMR